VPPEMQGRSIVPLAQRRAGAWDAWPDDVFVQISESHVGRAVRTRRWKYGVGAPDKDGWRDAASDRYVEQFLYDLACDPYELTNLIGFESHRATADVLKQRLLARMQHSGEPPATIANAEPRKSGQRLVTPEEANA